VQKVLIESTATVTGSHIRGIALTPTTSKNGNNYLPDVIDSAKNVNVLLDNLNWEHTNEKVGTVKFTVDPNSHTMYYEGNILSERRNQIKEGTHKVSIEAHVDEVARTCSPKTCYNTPMTLTMEGLAITSNPSVQTTSLMFENTTPFYTIGTSTGTNAQLGYQTPQKNINVVGKIITSPDELNDMLSESIHFIDPEKILKENEKIEQLEKEITELKELVKSSITCKTCGGIKKH